MTFYSIFDVTKIKYKSPAREVDNEGNISAWYVEERYPEIEGTLFFELLQIYNEYESIHGRTISCLNIDSNKLVKVLLDSIVVAYNFMILNDKEKAKEFKRDIEECFKEYALWYNSTEE